MARFGRRGRRQKHCRFCSDDVTHIDYKDIDKLNNYTQERGKIRPRRSTGACARHQRMLTSAIKRAREIALMPYSTG